MVWPQVGPEFSSLIRASELSALSNPPSLSLPVMFSVRSDGCAHLNLRIRNIRVNPRHQIKYANLRAYTKRIAVSLFVSRRVPHAAKQIYPICQFGHPVAKGPFE